MEQQIRKLAKSVYYQNLYGASKENSGIHLFENKTNFSGLQVMFLYWLRIYEMLYTELQTHENEFLTEKVIIDDDRCDAYLLIRSRENDRKWKEYRKEEKLQDLKSRNPNRKNKDNMVPCSVDIRRE